MICTQHVPHLQGACRLVVSAGLENILVVTQSLLNEIFLIFAIGTGFLLVLQPNFIVFLFRSSSRGTIYILWFSLCPIYPFYITNYFPLLFTSNLFQCAFQTLIFFSPYNFSFQDLSFFRFIVVLRERQYQFFCYFQSDQPLGVVQQV